MFMCVYMWLTVRGWWEELKETYSKSSEGVSPVCRAESWVKKCGISMSGCSGALQTWLVRSDAPPYVLSVFFPQAVPLAASSDGMDEGGHSSCRTSQESAGGQRWCQTDRQAAASRAGLWTKTAEVIESANIDSGPLLVFITQIWSRASPSCCMNSRSNASAF